VQALRELWSDTKMVISAVKSSGADEPAAMNVAPATSSDRCSFSEINLCVLEAV
jgi:hypothetical protein